MSVTITDLFCGAGGSSLGAKAAGGTLVMAANHWQTAIDVHQHHFPDAGHDCADISQADPRRYPRTDLLLASPECTNHSQARGVSRRRQDVSLFDTPDPTAERSRATMWDVVRFAEQLDYEAIVVENVVEAVKWTLFPAWWAAMEALGYHGSITNHNSMHHGVAQSRDRIYVVWHKGRRMAKHLDLEMQVDAWCPHCDGWVQARQGFKKHGRQAGRYKQSWIWCCITCGKEALMPATPAASIIDWDIDTPLIGAPGRRPLAAKTRDRIYAGLEKYGWVPVTTTGAGNTHERTPGNRARTLLDPVPTQQTTLTSAIALPPGFLFQTAHGGRITQLDQPHPTVTASDDRQALIIPLRSNGKGLDVNTHPIPAVTASGNHHGLLMRNNGSRSDGSEMVTPDWEPARTMTTAGHQSWLVPHSPDKTLTRDEVIDSCGFRMLEPTEVARAMAFPDGYIPTDLPKREQVKLAGNAVTPPVMTWIVGRLIQAMEAA